MNRSLPAFILTCFLFVVAAACFHSCANIIPPTGGPKDSLPPVLIKAEPTDSSLHFNTKKITLDFDEFVTIDNPQENVIIWPNPKNAPTIENKLRTVTIKLKDSLEPNTTYTINFGKGLKDVNEGNADENFSYVFSTGGKLDDNVLKGNVVLAETGKIDTTLLVVLQTNLSDTAIKKDPPRYYTKLDGKGNFRFYHLPTDTFHVFVVPNDYTKRYDDSTKLFAFTTNPVFLQDTSLQPLTLYAYQEVKATEKKPLANATTSDRASQRKEKGKARDSSLSVSADLDNGRQDFLSNLTLTFSDTLQSYDSSKFHFTDTNFIPLPGMKLTPDSSNTKLILSYSWKENTPYTLVIEKDAIADSSGNSLKSNDTLSFTTLRESDYGSLRMRFQNLDTARHPVLELIQNDKITQSVPLTSYEWIQKFIRPGDYQLRVLYDTNGNGIWDAGNYESKRQPEIVQEAKTISGRNKITLRTNWDNEENIVL